MRIRTKRVYEAAEPEDGLRVLVDRLWPRGVRKDAIDLWLKDIAPSGALRTWFGHEPERWAAFRSRYHKELQANPNAIADLKKAGRGKTVTPLYGARDETHNQAVALADYLKPKRTKKKKA
ncbi:MAG TPA: DUF488 domain-containing protein [Rhizomicrobium sp.]|jgi:uncharacterized protein YeaO (DUF488 family)